MEFTVRYARQITITYYVTSYSYMQQGFQKRLNSQKIPTGSMSSNKAFFMPVHML